MEKDGIESDVSEMFMKSTELEALDMNLLDFEQREKLADRVEAVKKFWPKGNFPFTDNDVLEIFLQIKNNAFMLSDKGGQFVGTAHHVDQSLFNHRCVFVVVVINREEHPGLLKPIFAAKCKSSSDAACLRNDGLNRVG